MGFQFLFIAKSVVCLGSLLKYLEQSALHSTKTMSQTCETEQNPPRDDSPDLPKVNEIWGAGNSLGPPLRQSSTAYDQENR